MVELRIIQHRLHAVVAQGDTAIATEETLELLRHVGLHALIDQLSTVDDQCVTFAQGRSRERQHIDELCHRNTLSTIHQSREVINDATSLLGSVNDIVRDDVEQVTVCTQHGLEDRRQHRVCVHHLIVTVSPAG